MEKDDKFTIFGQPDCIYCDKAKALLTLRDLPFEYHDVSDLRGFKNFLKTQGMTTVPVIYHGAKLIGGFDKLEDYL